MARPVKRRRVCKMPSQDTFGPMDQKHSPEEIIMSIEAYEVVRLMDYEGNTQEEAAELMGVARSTIQRMYDDARKIIADSLVNGKTLKIQGGNYTLCSDVTNEDGQNVCIRKKDCPKRESGKRCCEQ